MKWVCNHSLFKKSPSDRRIQLPLKYDQRALTFVNKPTYALLLKELYRTIIVDLSEYPRSSGPLLAMLNERNPGRKFIKGVVFDQTRLLDKIDPPSGFEQLAYAFLTNLDDGQLEYFRYVNRYRGCRIFAW